MKLEAVDPKHPSFICVCTVVQVKGTRMRLHFDGWSESYDFWTSTDSPFLFPVGWCEKNGQRLHPPRSKRKTMDCYSTAIPSFYFRPKWSKSIFWLITCYESNFPEISFGVKVLFQFSLHCKISKMSRISEKARPYVFPFRTFIMEILFDSRVSHSLQQFQEVPGSCRKVSFGGFVVSYVPVHNRPLTGISSYMFKHLLLRLIP